MEENIVVAPDGHQPSVNFQESHPKLIDDEMKGVAEILLQLGELRDDHQPSDVKVAAETLMQLSGRDEKASHVNEDGDISTPVAGGDEGEKGPKIKKVYERKKRRTNSSV